ncbi:MAG: pyrroloquinoline quinone-dependent dehydrogenase [Candidatus Azotimanducaceae bacterium]
MRFTLLLVAFITPLVNATEDTDWPNYASDPGSSKFAALDHINATNVQKVEVAWSWESPDNQMVKKNRKLTPWGFKSTPIKIGKTLYVSTSLGHVAAISADDGKTIWKFDTKTYADGRPTNLGFNHRGVAYWSDNNQEIIIMPTNNGYLWAIDAKTGNPIKRFGNDGRIDLTQDLGRPVNRKLYSVISAPIIVGNVVVVGASISDGPRERTMPPGHVRGFDVRSGKQLWIFHTIPQKGEFGVDTWEDDSWRYSGNTNVWTGISADTELGYIYLPTGTPTNDWYGGHRPGDNLFAESLVCLDAKTGERVWHFQMVHHGLWDYDLPAAPTLMDIKINNEAIPAVAQVSKQGFVYVFNRKTGEPVWPINETPVPQSNIPGEKSSPTQPVPTKPKPFDRQGLSEDDLINFTPELKRAALSIIKQFDYGPLYTPPTLRGTINLPGWGGGANWSGAAFDPHTNRLFIPSRTGPMVVKLKPGGDKTDFRFVRSRAVTSLKGPEGLPITKPPYSRITAIDMNTGDHVWMRPHGNGIRQKIIEKGISDPGPVGSRLGTGPLLTSSLLFLGQKDENRNLLRAFSKDDGAILAEVELPATPWGTPMSYLSKDRQYIVLATGEGADAKLIGLALPH